MKGKQYMERRPEIAGGHAGAGESMPQVRQERADEDVLNVDDWNSFLQQAKAAEAAQPLDSRQKPALPAREADAERPKEDGDGRKGVPAYRRINEKTQELVRLLENPASRLLVVQRLGGEDKLQQVLAAYKDNLKAEDVYLHRNDASPDNQKSISLMEQAMAAMGIRRVRDEEMQAAGFNPKRLDDRVDSGMSAALYRDEKTGNYTLAFRGTEPNWKDIRTDVGNAAGLKMAQYEKAASLATTLERNENFNDNLKFTGHSLGGGLASMAAAVTKLHAITFNPAGVDSLVVKKMGGSLQDIDQRVDGYYLNGEILHRVQSSVLVDAAANVAFLPFTRHVSGPGGVLDRVPSASGRQIALNAWLEDKPVEGMMGRLYHSFSLHSNQNVQNTLYRMLRGDADIDGKPAAPSAPQAAKEMRKADMALFTR
ncbi:lipase family protein [Chromobacterium phragmitis]|uniref:Lipase family protein n=1 Tax=Chromobacterium phragmitis TaxID=2202141 RepID=A0ABV0IR41_9NEIS